MFANFISDVLKNSNALIFLLIFVNVTLKSTFRWNVRAHNRYAIFDWIGFALIAGGLSGIWIGHHLFGLLWFWFGVGLVSLGCIIIVNELRRRRMEKNLRDYRGPGDYGDSHYHAGSSAASGFDSGGDAGGGSE